MKVLFIFSRSEFNNGRMWIFVDAAKRKALPAWIREGLEKMEREKQRKLDREKQLLEREKELIRRKQEEDEALASGIPLKSKFVCILKYQIPPHPPLRRGLPAW